ncbi:hypothetical protein Tco_0794782 [Tanacetum coccineum]
MGIPRLKTLSSLSDENGSKVSITGQRRLQINEIENVSRDRNLLDWTSKNILGSKILLLVPEGKETSRSDSRWDCLEGNEVRNPSHKGGMDGFLKKESLSSTGIRKMEKGESSTQSGVGLSFKILILAIRRLIFNNFSRSYIVCAQLSSKLTWAQNSGSDAST